MFQSRTDKLLKDGKVKADNHYSCDQLYSEFSRLGIPVNATDDGVKLLDIVDPLNHERISSTLLEFKRQHTLEIHQYIDSTNEHLVTTFNDQNLPAICLAEYQLKGHGRRGTHWHSTYGKDFNCSIAWPILSGQRVTGVMSLVIALSLVNVLEDLGLSNVEVKWPNDLFVGGRKIAGILIEQVFNSTMLTLIVGVGLNLFKLPSRDNMSGNREFIATSVEEELGTLERNMIAIKLIDAIFAALSEIPEQLDTPMMLAWKRHDYLRDKNITIKQKNISQGLYQGIDSSGHLLLNIDGKVLKFSSGHITGVSK
ncbi:MAG: biotin--[acetyl-CoA-carboxylase] ligase [Chromatiales bacterium]|nr:biotin--[acetyl-CoA-carboxylase] ligase [Chromatiales bacterium]